MGSPATRPGEHRAKHGLNLNASGGLPQHLPAWFRAQPEVYLVLWVPHWAPCCRRAVPPLLFQSLGPRPGSAPGPWGSGTLLVLGRWSGLEASPGGAGAHVLPSAIPSGLWEAPGCLRGRRPLSGHSALSLAFQGHPLCLEQGLELNCEPMCSTSNQTHTFSVSLRTVPEGWACFAPPPEDVGWTRGGLRQRSPVSAGDGAGAGRAPRCGSAAQSAHGQESVGGGAVWSAESHQVESGIGAWGAARSLEGGC